MTGSPPESLTRRSPTVSSRVPLAVQALAAGTGGTEAVAGVAGPVAATRAVADDRGVGGSDRGGDTGWEGSALTGVGAATGVGLSPDDVGRPSPASLPPASHATLPATTTTVTNSVNDARTPGSTQER